MRDGALPPSRLCLQAKLRTSRSSRAHTISEQFQKAWQPGWHSEDIPSINTLFFAGPNNLAINNLLATSCYLHHEGKDNPGDLDYLGTFGMTQAIIHLWSPVS